MKPERITTRRFWAHFMIIVMLACTISTGALAGSSQGYEAYAQNQSLQPEGGATTQSDSDSMPASDGDIVLEDNNAKITFSWDEGVFPEGTMPEMKVLSTKEAKKLASKGMDGEVTDAFAVDIKFSADQDGKTIQDIQPAKKDGVHVNIEIKGRTLKGESFTVMHQDANTGKLDIVENASADAKGTEFVASAFSVYVIGGETGKKRVEVVYTNAGAILMTKIVHEGDVLDAPDDPVASGSNLTFDHWAADNLLRTDLTEVIESGELTSSQIDYLAKVGEASEDDTSLYKITANAVFRDAYRVEFAQYGYKENTEDPDNKVLAGTRWTTKGRFGRELIDLTELSDTFTVAGSVENRNLALVGWAEYEEGAAAGSDPAKEYARDDTITVTKNTKLYPIIKEGYWVKMDTLGAPAMSSVFVIKGDKLKAEDLVTPEENFYEGYEFDGWYTSYTAPTDEDTGRYDESCYSGEVTGDIDVNDSMSLYAKWNPGTSQYTVIHMVEGPEGGPGDGKYTVYSIMSMSGTTEGTIDIPSYGTTYQGTSIEGYHIPGSDENPRAREGDGYTLNNKISEQRISRDGSTVVYVYWNRNRIKMSIPSQYDPGMDPKYGGYIESGRYYVFVKNEEDIEIVDPNKTIRNAAPDGQKQWVTTYQGAEVGLYMIDVAGHPDGIHVRTGMTDGSSYSYRLVSRIPRQSTNWDYRYYEVLPGKTYDETFDITIGSETKTFYLDHIYKNGSQVTNYRNNKIVGGEREKGYTEWAYTGSTRSDIKKAPAIETTYTNAQFYAVKEEGAGRYDYGIDRYLARNVYKLSLFNANSVDEFEDADEESVLFEQEVKDFTPSYVEGKTVRKANGNRSVFAGWFTNQGAALKPNDPASERSKIDIDTLTMPAQDTSLYAAWIPVSYTVKYDARGGEFDGGDGELILNDVEDGSLLTEPDRPERTAYDFAGWFSNSSLTRPWDFVNNPVRDDMTLYAKWVKNESYTLKYMDAQGTEISGSSEQFYYGSIANVADQSIDTQSTGVDELGFIGWSTEPKPDSVVDGTVGGDVSKLAGTKITVEGDVTLYATYGNAVPKNAPEDTEDGAPSAAINGTDPKGAVEVSYPLQQPKRVNDEVYLPSEEELLEENPSADADGYILFGYTDDTSDEIYEPASMVAIAADTVFRPIWSMKVAVKVTGSDVTKEISFDKATGSLNEQTNDAYEVKYILGTEEADALPDDIGDINCDIQAGEAKGSHAGKYTAEVSAELTGTDESHKYAIAEEGSEDSADIILTITKAKINAVITGGSKTYGEEDPDQVGTVEYRIGDETAACFTPTLSREAGEDAGKYSLVLETSAPEGDDKITLDDVVMSDNSAKAKFRINKKVVELEWTDTEFTYDGDDHKPTATVTNAKEGDTVTVTVAGGTKVAGTHTATATGLSNDNYALPEKVTETFVIKQDTLEPTVSMSSWTYGDKAATPSLEGNTGNGNVTYLYTMKDEDDWSDTKPSDAGEYTVKAVISATDGYEGAAPTADFTISKRTAELSWTELAFVYDGEAHVPSAGITNLAKGDEVSVEVSGEQTEPGTYTAAASKLTGRDAANYALPEGEGETEQEFTISEGTPLPVVTIADWTYGDEANEPSVEGNPGDGAVTYTYAKEGTEDFEDAVPLDAGRYLVKATIEAAGGYEGAEAVTSFTIRQKTAMISWSNTSLTYNGEEQCPQAEVINLAGGDSCDVTVEGAKTDAGEYNARAVSLSDSNYKLPDTVTQVFIIAKANIDYDSNGFSGVYDGKEHSISVTVKAPENAEIRYGTSKDSIELEENPAYKDVGSHTVYYRISAGDNYNAVTGKEAVQILDKPSSGGGGGGSVTPTPSPEPTPTPEPTPEPEPTPTPDRSDQMGEDGTALGRGASWEAAEKAILGMTSDADPAGSKIMPLKAKSIKQTKKSVRVQWSKPTGAVKYVVYGNKCGKKNKMKRLKTTTKPKINFKKIAGKKVKKGTSYKFIVVALDKDNNVVSTSKVVHAVTKGTKKGNPTKLTVKSPKSLKKTLAAGKSFTIKSKVSRKKGTKGYLHVAKNYKGIRYESSNPAVAKVSKSGKVTAISAGTAKIIVYTQNGINKTINVTVK